MKTTDQFDQYRNPRDARKRVRLYAERFLALAREGSQGEDDEQAPRVDVVDHVTLDVRDLLALTASPNEEQIGALLYEYNRQHREATGCTCRIILAGMTAHGCPNHDPHDEDAG